MALTGQYDHEQVEGSKHSKARNLNLIAMTSKLVYCLGYKTSVACKFGNLIEKLNTLKNNSRQRRATEKEGIAKGNRNKAFATGYKKTCNSLRATTRMRIYYRATQKLVISCWIPTTLFYSIRRYWREKHM